MSLRPPSTSPSPSPGPHSRASLQPQPRGSAAAAANLAPISTRPNFTPGARPTSELLGIGSATFQTPETEAIDQWFENLQNYEATLEDMAAASLDVNFKEELSAIEQWFRVLSEAERTAALYSLLQHSTQVQIRFFITVLQQMARSDPMTALLSPAVGSSMQSQMEAKLASMGLKSPGLPPSPSVRSFNTGTPPMGASANNGRQSLSLDPSTYLSPETAQKAPLSAGAGGNDAAAAALANSRAKLKATNPSHRLSAPGPLLSESGGRPVSLWAGGSLGQVAERAPSPATSDLAPSSNTRPKSTDFTGLANQFARSPAANSGASGGDDANTSSNDIDLSMQELRLNEQLSPMVGGSWASMVNTPMVPMFTDGSAIGARNSSLDAASEKLANWTMGGPPRGVVLDDAKKFRRDSKGNQIPTNGSAPNGKSDIGSDNNSLAPPGGNKWTGARGSSPSNAGSWRAGSRSPVSSARFGGSDAGSAATSNFSSGVLSPGMGLGMGMGNFGGMFNGLSPVGMGGMGGLQQNALEAQILAAQLNGAFSPSMTGAFPNAAAAAASMGMGMGNFGMGMGMGVQGQPGGPAGPGRSRTTLGAGRGGATGLGNASPNNRAFNKSATRPAGGKNKQQLKDEDITPALLNDIPAWFHVLRLHKYTPVVQGKSWQELVIMDDATLEKLGITALGARRKLLKHFVVVRNKFNIPHPEGAETGDASDGEDGADGDAA